MTVTVRTQGICGHCHCACVPLQQSSLCQDSFKLLYLLLQHISYVLQSNTSANWFKGHYQNPNTYYQVPLQLAAERATARYLTNGMQDGALFCIVHRDTTGYDMCQPASPCQIQVLHTLQKCIVQLTCSAEWCPAYKP